MKISILFFILPVVTLCFSCEKNERPKLSVTTSTTGGTEKVDTAPCFTRTNFLSVGSDILGLVSDTFNSIYSIASEDITYSGKYCDFTFGFRNGIPVKSKKYMVNYDPSIFPSDDDHISVRYRWRQILPVVFFANDGYVYFVNEGDSSSLSFCGLIFRSADISKPFTATTKVKFKN